MTRKAFRKVQIKKHINFINSYNMNKKELKPARVFEKFAEINKIPRPSKHEEKMIEYLRNFGESRGLETHVDETGNVLIKKAATKGYENKKTITLQSHMDMVCDKLVDVDFDFNKDAIPAYIDGEWMRSKGTTLGADDGIGDAIELAILDSDDIEHGPIECLFTRDEETGLTGAEGLKEGFMAVKCLSILTLKTKDKYLYLALAV
jgi:dipeptidase D